MGHEVTVYCRDYFTAALAEYNGMRLVRLPTIRLKHLETVIHTLLSTIHSPTQRYDIVYYHSLGSARVSSLPRLFGKRLPSPCKAWTGNEKNGGGLRRRCFGWENEPRVLFPTAEYCENEASRGGSWNGDCSPADKFCSWEDFRRKRAAICSSRRSNRSRPT
jgi:hypothetical protein